MFELPQNPWWEASLAWDAITTGGVGFTAPVFYAVGASDEPVTSKDTTSLLKTAALLAAASALGDFVAFGIYGSLTDRGWSPWKAGAMTGLIGGALTVASLLAAKAIVKRPLLPKAEG